MANLRIGATRIFRSAGELLDDVPRNLVMLHGLRFAANFGACLRAAHLLGADAVMHVAGVPDRRHRTGALPWAAPGQERLLHEALRISMAQRHEWPLRVALLSREMAMSSVQECRSRGWRVFCVERDTHGTRESPTPLGQGSLQHSHVLHIFGAEDVGVPPDILEISDEVVSIPTVHQGSLNVSHAVALVLHERARQLRSASRGNG